MIDNTNPQYTINNTKGLATRTVMKTKISLIENKIPDDSSLVTTTVVNTKLSDLRIKFLIMLSILLLKNLITHEQKFCCKIKIS